MSIKEKLDALEKQKQKLIEEAHAEAFAKAEAAVQELNELGFNYKLTGGTASAGRKRAGGRRSGIRDSVLATVKQSKGVKPAEIASKLGISDASGKQSIANALSALKKAGAVKADRGVYRAA